MGNQLTGIAPSQIYPVDHYLTGLLESDLAYESSLGSTRFFKVARAKSDEGPIVVKVFVKNDPSLPLESHADKLEAIKRNLANAVNCLPFQRVIVTDKAGFIIREFVKHSLYDRVSTRPFLTTTEKKWITFQVLCALHQCHKQKICHGDIKLENILITSWNWILLSDFASFKPTFLPEDNPADYTYFFDTSRRRTCYIAPERFIASANMELSTIVGEGPAGSGTLTPEMDIFSAGCALLELWSEGTAPFEFSQLLNYRGGEEELVAKHLQGIANERLRSLLSSMLSRDPCGRKSAEVYLDEERGILFPEYFYSFLQSYMQMFSSIPIMPPDDKIQRLHLDIRQIVDILVSKETRVDDPEDDDLANADEDGLILITTAVTANARGLNHCRSKLDCLAVLREIAEHTTSVIILDRILPTILHMTKDTSSRVRSCAIDVLTECLELIETPPRSDVNVFPEYILPVILGMCSDPATGVRIALARNVANLAETSLRFLDQTRLIYPAESNTQRYERELATLHDTIQTVILSLLTDGQTIVKQTLIESGIAKICIFLGRSKAYDVVLSHMNTFLNDMEDKHLRGSFFDCIVGVAAFVGWTCSENLIPLLQQGLTDSEEFVITKAIHAITAFVELGLLEKPTLLEILRESACFLVHPNLWIRHEICALVTTAAKQMTPLDVQCKLMPVLRPHLKSSLILVDQPDILMDHLDACVPRSIYDNVITFQAIEQFFTLIDCTPAAGQERKSPDFMANLISNNTSMTTTTSINSAGNDVGRNLSNQLLRRLVQDGLTEHVERQLCAMKHLLVKINKYKMAAGRSSNDGKIVLSPHLSILHAEPLVERRSTALSSGHSTGNTNTNRLDSSSSNTNKNKFRKPEIDAMNQEWQHMFGVMDLNSPMAQSPSNEALTNQVGSAGQVTGGIPIVGVGTTPPMLNLPNMTIQPMPSSSSLVEYSMPERNLMQEKLSECSVALSQIKDKLKNDYVVLAANRDYDCYDYYSPIPAKWQPKGTLVAHLHEHKSAVTRMCALKPFGSYFASASVDGTVRLWDASKLDGERSINRSRQTYMAVSPLYCVASCEGGQSLAVAGKDGMLLLLRIDPNSNKMALQQARNLETTDAMMTGGTLNDGPIVDMQSLDQSAQNLIIYATLYGGIVGWDIRMPGFAWRLQSDLKNGVITTMCVDPTSSWLAIGTSGGRHTCWDLRFTIPIAEIRHPNEARIRKIVCHPTERASLVSASQGNNEVCVYNIETGHRQAALWASPSPPLSVANVNNQSVTALVPGIAERTDFVLTAGTDQRIRYWDFGDQTKCRMVVAAPKDAVNAAANTAYEYRLIDGTKVINELKMDDSGGCGGGGASRLTAGASSSQEDSPRTGPETPPVGHIDGITDLVLCKNQRQMFIASSSRDGVIKLWK